MQVPELTELVNAAVNLDFEAIPDPIKNHATLVWTDTIGVVLAGRNAEEVQATSSFANASGASWSVSAGSKQVDVKDAAFVNALAATTVELDELIVGGGAGGHPGIHIVPVALAVAQELDCSGSDLFNAIIAGYEVTGRLFKSVTLHPEVQPHGHIGTIGAAVAVAMLRGIPATEAARVASALPTISLWATTLESATVHNVYPSVSTQNALLACNLVRSGFSGPKDSFETLYTGLIGESSSVTPTNLSPSDLVIFDNTIKLHACCGRLYSAVDCALQFRGLDVSSISSVEVEVDGLAGLLASTELINDQSAKFSLPYAVATTLINGHANPSAFVLNPDTAALCSKISIRSDELKLGVAPEDRWARISVTDRSGRHVRTAMGLSAAKLKAPLDETQIRDKFVRNVEAAGWGDASGKFERLMSLRDIDNVRNITAGW